MVSGADNEGVQTDRRRTIADVCRQGLVFGERSADHVGEATLDDGVVQVNFLLYVLGAIDLFGDQIADGRPLAAGEKLAAMAEALAAFETSTADEIRATVLALDSASGHDAMRMRAEGRRAAAQWCVGDRHQAERHFANMLRGDPGLPSELEPVLRPLAGLPDGAP